MEIDRRQFGIAAATFALGACARILPTEPTEIPVPKTVNPFSEYGNFYRTGYAGIEGTLEQVLAAARLSPEITSVGLLTSLEGRLPILVPAMDKRGYIFHIRENLWFGNGVRELPLKRGEAWHLFDWNGKNPPSNLERLRLPEIWIS